MFTIREYTEGDKEQIWQIIKAVISGGDTYSFAPDSPKEYMLDFWCGADKRTYVAVEDEKIVGTFFLKENQPGLGSHVGNAGYMVASGARTKGIGRKMGEFSIEEAKRLGFKAIQFNYVVKSNERAVKLWKSLGFEVIGEIPDGFQHKENGLTNVYIMYRKV
jgi:ribosomal protein S18 acetylase RimI-like enzyme